MLKTKNEIMKFLYNEDGTKRVGGFWKDSLFEVYIMIDDIQKDIDGNIIEIGVYCGRSFLPIANFKKKNEYAIGIDVFSNTNYFNINNSEKIIRDLVKECYNDDKIIILKENSKTILKDKKLKSYGKSRLFSIDGNHSISGTTNDLQIALENILPNGIIFLDDYLNVKYSKKILQSIRNFLDINTEWDILFGTTEKLFLCNKKYFTLYQQIIFNLDSSWIISVQSFPSFKLNIPTFENKQGKNCWLYKQGFKLTLNGWLEKEK